MHADFFRLALASPRLVLGQPMINAQKAIDQLALAQKHQVDLLLFPSCFMTGVTAGDWLGHDLLLQRVNEALAEIQEASRAYDFLIAMGAPCKTQGRVQPAYYFYHQGRLLAQALPDQAAPLLKEEGPRGFLLTCDFSWPARQDINADLVIQVNDLPALAGQEDLEGNLLQAASYRGPARLLLKPSLGESTGQRIYLGQSLVAEAGQLVEGQQIDQLSLYDLDLGLVRKQRLFPKSSQDQAEELVTWHRPIEASMRQSLYRPVSAHPFVQAVSHDMDQVLDLQARGLAERMRAIGAETAFLGVSGGLDSTLAIFVVLRALDLLGLDHSALHCVTMPAFGTSDRTYGNINRLMGELSCTFYEISLQAVLEQHFADIGLSLEEHSLAFENAQARERTQILMDLSNMHNGLVVGTGDLSENALGWSTYNGDQMSMYAVNASIPKTLAQALVAHLAHKSPSPLVRAVLLDIVDTPISPELLPSESGEIAQKTEDSVGPYELQDLFLYHFMAQEAGPRKLLALAQHHFQGKYSAGEILRWMSVFFRRLASSQFKRSAYPDAPWVAWWDLSAKTGFDIPSDMSAKVWLEELEALNKDLGDLLE